MQAIADSGRIAQSKTRLIASSFSLLPANLSYDRVVLRWPQADVERVAAVVAGREHIDRDRNAFLALVQLDYRRELLVTTLTFVDFLTRRLHQLLRDSSEPIADNGN